MTALSLFHLNEQTWMAASGSGSSDSMTLGIAHKEGLTVILDVVREIKPPFSPEAVVEEFTALLKKYRVASVGGDRYAGESCEQLKQRRYCR